MLTEAQRDLIADWYGEELLMLPGDYDHCIVGFMERCGQPPLVVYDRELVLLQLVREGMTPEEADEYFDFNIIGAWLGEHTPGFITTRLDQLLAYDD